MELGAGTEPKLRHMPRVIEFLGYALFECPEDSVGKLKYFKLVKGLSYARLGGLIGRDPEQLTDWLCGRIKPSQRDIRELKSSY